jgi:hypothetical protein
MSVQDRLASKTSPPESPVSTAALDRGAILQRRCGLRALNTAVSASFIPRLSRGVMDVKHLHRIAGLLT